jgi:hypothetical protein
VSERGEISIFQSSVRKENIRCFLDNLNDHTPSFIGTLEPKHVDGLHESAQWLSGIAAGAWFELHKNGSEIEYRFRRVSPYGNVDIDAIYRIDDESFEYHESFEFIQYSNCHFFHIKQKETIYRFEKLKD